jgi:hypothetical protein
MANDQRNHSADPAVVAAEQKVWSTLLRLLPRIDPQESHLIGDEGHKILHNILTASDYYGQALERYDRYHPNMHYAILKALNKVGDNRDLPVLRRVASGKISGVAEGVQEAAQDTVEVIKARRSGEEPRRQLLRSSQSPGQSQEELLRPTSAVLEMREQELLRAVGDSGDSSQ